MRRPLKIVVGISILVALLFAGVMFGQTGHYFFKKHSHRSLEAMTSVMPESKREMFAERMRAAMKESRALSREARKEQKKARAILETEPFDKTAYLSHMQQVGQLRSLVRQRMSQAVADIAEQCTQEERIALDAALKQRYRKKSPR